MESNFETLLRTMTEQFAQLNTQMNNRFNRMEECVANLERTHETHTELELETPFPTFPTLGEPTP